MHITYILYAYPLLQVAVMFVCPGSCRVHQSRCAEMFSQRVRDAQTLSSVKNTWRSTSQTEWNAGKFSSHKTSSCGRESKTSLVIYRLVYSPVEVNLLMILIWCVWSGHSAPLPLVPGGYVMPRPPFFRPLCSKLCAVSLALGTEHAVLLTSDGTVYSWGSGRYEKIN